MKHSYIYIVLILCFVRCAQITPLTGGKKDTEAPKLIKATPVNASLNFSSKTIELQFDEYITLKDVINQFIITPQTKDFPEIEASGKKVIIKFTEPLLPNTTYKLSFGNSIIDLRESNNLPNFEYVFSTGNTIDSLTLRGHIYNAIDKTPSTQISVGLYSASAEDSAIYKDKPLYLIKTNDEGKFVFTHLPDKKFKLAAIKDINKNLLYDGSDEQIAYPDKIINPKDSGEINILLFKEVPFKSFIRKPVAVEYGKVYIIYNKGQAFIKEVQAKGLILYTQNKAKDTLTLFYNNTYDTLQTIIHYTNSKTDTLYVKIPSVNMRKDRQSDVKSYKYIFNTNIETIMPFYKTLKFDINFPVNRNNILENKITLTEQQDTLKPVIKPYNIIAGKDPVTNFSLEADLKPEANYTLTIADSALTNSPNRYNDSITYKFKTNSADDYGQLNLKLVFPKKENYIVMLQNSSGLIVDERTISLPLTSTADKMIEYKNLLPGNYFIKVIEDANNNSEFDAGNYFLHSQPETVFINNTPIKLLAGWEIENEWIIKE